jgi:hypothetical protein
MDPLLPAVDFVVPGESAGILPDRDDPQSSEPELSTNTERCIE